VIRNWRCRSLVTRLVQAMMQYSLLHCSYERYAGKTTTSVTTITQQIATMAWCHWFIIIIFIFVAMYPPSTHVWHYQFSFQSMIHQSGDELCAHAHDINGGKHTSLHCTCTHVPDVGCVLNLTTLGDFGLVHRLCTCNKKRLRIGGSLWYYSYI